MIKEFFPLNFLATNCPPRQIGLRIEKLCGKNGNEKNKNLYFYNNFTMALKMGEPTILFSIILLLNSCDKVRLYKDSKIATEILGEVRASGGQLAYTEDLSSENNPEKYYIELNVNNSQLLKEGITKELVSSFVALQLFVRLDPKSINKNSGINVIFDKNNFPIKQHFYSNTDLENARISLSSIEQLFFCNPFEYSVQNEVFDTSYMHYSNKKLSSLIDSVQKRYQVKNSRIYPFFRKQEAYLELSKKTISTFEFIILLQQNNNSFKQTNFISLYNSGRKNVINILL